MTLPLAREPWVHIPGRELQNWGKQQEIEYNQQNRQAEKLKFFVNAFDFLTDNRVQGEYWEFGCHRARTFRMALSEARKHSLAAMKFVAFDSFEGLPEPDKEQVVEIWKKGALCTTESEFRQMIEDLGVYVDKVDLVKGFYEDSLNLQLIKQFTSEGRIPALVNVDCDLYESAREAFRFLLLFVQPGLQIYLDDYYAGYKGSPLEGVRLAFREFENKLADLGMNVTPHMQVGWWGKSFIVY